MFYAARVAFRLRYSLNPELEVPPDFDAQDADGRTALHYILDQVVVESSVLFMCGNQRPGRVQRTDRRTSPHYILGQACGLRTVPFDAARSSSFM